jgi:hypothetical protein
MSTPTPQAEIQATADVKQRCARLATSLEAIATNSDTVFADPRGIFISLVLAEHEVAAALAVVRRTWWPVILAIIACVTASSTFAAMPRAAHHHERTPHKFHFPRPPEQTIEVDLPSFVTQGGTK